MLSVLNVTCTDCPVHCEGEWSSGTGCSETCGNCFPVFHNIFFPVVST